MQILCLFILSEQNYKPVVYTLCFTLHIHFSLKSAMLAKKKNLIRTCSALIFFSVRSDVMFCEHNSNHVMQIHNFLSLQKNFTARTPSGRLHLLAVSHKGSYYSKEKIFIQTYPYYPQSHFQHMCVICTFLITLALVPKHMICFFNWKCLYKHFTHPYPGLVYSFLLTLGPESTTKFLHFLHTIAPDRWSDSCTKNMARSP